MPSDRRSWLRRQRPQASVEAAPEVVAEEMEAATQRLRDQAWKINATTKTPMIVESHDAAAETASDPSADS